MTTARNLSIKKKETTSNYPLTVPPRNHLSKSPEIIYKTEDHEEREKLAKLMDTFLASYDLTNTQYGGATKFEVQSWEPWHLDPTKADRIGVFISPVEGEVSTITAQRLERICLKEGAKPGIVTEMSGSWVKIHLNRCEYTIRFKTIKLANYEKTLMRVGHSSPNKPKWYPWG